MTMPPQPFLSPAAVSSSEVSPLSLPPSPLCAGISDLSLASLDCGTDDSSSSHGSEESEDGTSSADTDASCASACCDPTHPESYKLPPCATQRVIASVPESAWSPLLIIGAGPHALALAARLNEPRPAALYTDLEHARLSWLQRGATRRQGDALDRRHRPAVKGHWPARKLVAPKQATLVNVGDLGPEALGTSRAPAVRVVDSSGSQWLARWDSFFDGLSISHLRSPMTFHPSPADVDALVSYARRTDRETELEAIKGVVGSEFSKYQRKKRRATVSVGGSSLINERDRQDYQRPSTPLFRDFLQDDLIERYAVPQVEHERVTAVSYGLLHVENDGLRTGFLVESILPDGTLRRTAAQAITMAIGPSSVPAVPRWLAGKAGQPAGVKADGDPWRKDALCGEGWCHSSSFAVPGCRPLDGPLGQKTAASETTRVCVVGGGLTSAQIVDSLLKQGVSSVLLLVRSRIKTKHFDFDLEWVSKYSNLRKMEIFQETDPFERFEQIRSSRNGGSVNPTFAKILKQHEKSGRLEIRTMTEVEEAHYDPEAAKWILSTVTREHLRGASGEATREVICGIDFVVASTGSKLDFAGVDFLEPLRQAGHLPETVNGLPVLTRDLQLSPTLPFFVLGAYAMLELGPDALNLSGTRAGAERVANRLGELGIFPRYPTFGHEPSKRMQAKQARTGGEGNFFEGLGEVEA